MTGFVFTPWRRCLEYSTWFKKKTSYNFVCRLVLSHPYVVEYCMKGKCATLYLSFLFTYMILYRLRMA